MIDKFVKKGFDVYNQRTVITCDIPLTDYVGIRLHIIQLDGSSMYDYYLASAYHTELFYDMEHDMGDAVFSSEDVCNSVNWAYAINEYIQENSNNYDIVHYKKVASLTKIPSEDELRERTMKKLPTWMQSLDAFIKSNKQDCNDNRQYKPGDKICIDDIGYECVEIDIEQEEDRCALCDLRNLDHCYDVSCDSATDKFIIFKKCNTNTP